jgi:hypothetical protein
MHVRPRGARRRRLPPAELVGLQVPDRYRGLTEPTGDERRERECDCDATGPFVLGGLLGAIAAAAVAWGLR